MKKLYRSTTDRVIAGVCGGLGEYIGTDPNIVRLVTLLGLLITGIFPVGIVYLVAMFLVPQTSEDGNTVIDGKTE